MFGVKQISEKKDKPFDFSPNDVSSGK